MADQEGVPAGPRAEHDRLVRRLARPRRAVRRVVPLRWRRRLAVLAGSAAGTGLRAVVGLLPHPADGWPWGTFAANVSGALLLGYLLTRFQQAASTTSLTVPLLCTGLLGGYTTFSAFAAEVHTIAAAGRAGLAVAYAAASVAGGYLAALAGARAAEARP